jgi:hypothetical protein
VNQFLSAGQERTRESQRGDGTNENHDAPDGSLDGDSLITEDADETGLTANWRESNEGSVVGHDGLDLLEAFGQHPVELAWQDRRVPRDDALAL